MTLRLRPVHFAEACAFVTARHRHHKPPQGHKFSIAAEQFGRVVGVVMVGRPVARRLDDGLTAEVTRLCTDGTPDACSLLYGAAARAAKAMGYTRILTYILDSEPGTSLRAAGWRRENSTPGKSWSVPARPREDKHPLGTKVRWVRDLAAAPELGVFG